MAQDIWLYYLQFHIFVIVIAHYMQKTYPIEGDDMTLEIQALINHNQSTHTLHDSKKLQETIERIREEAK